LRAEFDRTLQQGARSIRTQGVASIPDNLIRRTSASDRRGWLLGVESANSISEPAAVRSALERGWGHQSLSARFVDFFTAIATTSNVCYGLQSGHSRREFFGA
jgi:hypothetical protein